MIINLSSEIDKDEESLRCRNRLVLGEILINTCSVQKTERPQSLASSYSSSAEDKENQVGTNPPSLFNSGLNSSRELDAIELARRESVNIKISPEEMVR